MNPDLLLAKLREVLGGARPPAPTPLPTVHVTAPAASIGPSTQTLNAERYIQPEAAPGLGRLAAELGVGLMPGPVGASPDIAATVRDAAHGNYGSAALNATFAGLGMMPVAGPLSRYGREMARHGGDLVRRLFGTHELIPGKGTGHLRGLLNAPLDERQAYSAVTDWRAPDGRDALYRAAGFEPDVSRPGTGLYRPDAQTVESNPMWVARAPAPDDVAAINTVESVRALLDAQNAGAYHSVTRGATGTGLRLPMRNPADAAWLDDADRVAQGWNGGAVDTGRGVTVLGPLWDQEAMNVTPADMLARLRAHLTGAPLTGAPYPAHTAPQNYFSLFENAPPGGGRATQQVFGDADPATLARLGNDPDVLRHIEASRYRDRLAARDFQGENRTFDQLRGIASEPGGLSRLWQMAQNNGIEGRDLPGLLLAGGALGAGAASASDSDGEGTMQASLLGGLLGAGLVGAAGRGLAPTLRDQLNAANPRLRRWLGGSVLQTPDGVPLPVTHSTAVGDLTVGGGQQGGMRMQVRPVNFDTFRMPAEGSRQLGIHVAGDPRQGDRFSTYMDTPKAMEMLTQADDATREYMRQNPTASLDEAYRSVLAFTDAYAKPMGRTLPLYARAENPLRLADYGSWSGSRMQRSLEETAPDVANELGRYADLKDLRESQLRQMLQGLGFDSIVYRNRYEGVRPEHALAVQQAAKAVGLPGIGSVPREAPEALWENSGVADSYILFSPTQLKSAIGNDGGFRRNTANINRGLLMGLLGGGTLGAMNAAERPDEQP